MEATVENTKEQAQNLAGGEFQKHPANELTTEEVKSLIGEAVKASLSEALNQSDKRITDAVAEAVQKAVTAKVSEAVTVEDARKLAEEAAKQAIAQIRREAKPVSDPADATRHVIEIPVSWCKGNLPLHGKQLLNILMRRPMNEGISEDDLNRGIKLGDAMISRMQYGFKALTSTGSGTGDELVPTDLSAELQRRMYMASKLYALLAPYEVAMPTQPYTMPLSTTRPTFYYESTEAQAGTESTPGTGLVTLDAKKFMAKVTFSYELAEDAIIPILPWVERLLGEAAAECFESVVINGDDSATHMDSDINAVQKASQKAFKGFRKYALAQIETKKDLSTGGISAANIRALLKLMKKYAANPRDCVIICGIAGKNDLLALSEVMTADKAGANATLFGNPLETIWGAPIVESAQCREDLNASGVYDGTTKTKGSILVVNRTQFIIGRRRDFMVETFRDIDYQVTKVVASFRRGMTPLETPSSSVTSLAIGYNYTA